MAPQTGAMGRAIQSPFEMKEKPRSRLEKRKAGLHDGICGDTRHSSAFNDEGRTRFLSGP
jgi:hypothetical protein